MSSFIDDIIKYVYACYVLPLKARWCIYEYDLHQEKSNVQRFQVHLTHQNFVIFNDDFFRYYYIYLIRSKNKFLDRFKIFKAEAHEIQTEKILKRLRSERGRGYT